MSNRVVVRRVLTAVLLSVFGFWCVLSLLDARESYKYKMEDLSWYHHHIKSQSMVNAQGSCEVWSLDGGKNWFAIERQGTGKDEQIKLADPAKQLVCQKDVAQWQAIEALVADAQKNGPIGAHGPITPEQKKMLEGAGFTVTEKQK